MIILLCLRYSFSKYFKGRYLYFRTSLNGDKNVVFHEPRPQHYLLKSQCRLFIFFHPVNILCWTQDFPRSRHLFRSCTSLDHQGRRLVFSLTPIIQRERLVLDHDAVRQGGISHYHTAMAQCMLFLVDVSVPCYLIHSSKVIISHRSEKVVVYGQQFRYF